MPRRSSGTISTRATSRNRTGTPPSARIGTISRRRRCRPKKPRPRNEPEFRQLDRAPAGIHAAGGDGLADFGQGDTERPISAPTTVTEYCLTKPPTLATSDTPSARLMPAHHPVLQGPQLASAEVLALQRILIDLLDARAS